MVPISKVAGVLSCGFLLCLGLSNAASAVDDMKAGQSEWVVPPVAARLSPSRLVV